MNETNRSIVEREKMLNFDWIVMRYDLDEDWEWPDILNELCSRNQRLNLAIAMLNTRYYWGDGPHLVESALDRFVPQNEEDQAIFDNVSETLARWEDKFDGRIFRDCRWNYNRIFESIEDRQLVNDALIAHKWVIIEGY